MSETRKRLTLYPPISEAAAANMDALRADLIALGEDLEENLPAGRELSLALTKLEELAFWAIAAIARNQPEVST